jgi:N-acetylmuramoyl-L-alanine amidase
MKCLWYPLSHPHKLGREVSDMRRAHHSVLWIGIFLVFFTALGIHLFLPRTQTAFYPVIHQQDVLIIDAGHGGADGGAVSPSGTVESGINLSIAQKLNALCGLYGVPSKMTRQDDNSIHDPSATTLREQKRSDLENRVSLINETVNGVLISIHQNTYPSSSSCGTQVFYSSETSQTWAAAAQSLIAQTLDPENIRQAAKISDSVYLMQNISCDGLLVECGFLSNPTDEALLTDDQYQTKLAGVLLTSFLTQR